MHNWWTQSKKKICCWYWVIGSFFIFIFHSIVRAVFIYSFNHHATIIFIVELFFHLKFYRQRNWKVYFPWNSKKQFTYKHTRAHFWVLSEVTSHIVIDKISCRLNCGLKALCQGNFDNVLLMIYIKKSCFLWKLIVFKILLILVISLLLFQIWRWI